MPDRCTHVRFRDYEGHAEPYRGKEKNTWQWELLRCRFVSRHELKQHYWSIGRRLLGDLGRAVKQLRAGDRRLDRPETVLRLKQVLETYTDITRYPRSDSVRSFFKPLGVEQVPRGFAL
ncbi:hypothetical protein VOLCADRAFT_87947 [Volvox carteri f. nagariensis]|uniref:Uncharacterized protein n=1 Tax=Volvox carteri f. nagariensis TaxID=3068 RepID=D8TMN5_VOLCA|nr:uncharacterized protein VOLCADRAFT_87947 [Volvox carteri f. nagariensis]EFJ51156.1 hypothetical protein VOLCADRAFT_87947 [Volvox carteri f. nagariensis]|eukprot:XP_002947623.1 hypothetical protein VOLCADRAFT_87947 [Volvox carteri f. nagariensis]